MEQFSVYGDTYLNDRYSVYERLRNEAPAYFSKEMNSWFITRYEDVSSLLRSNDLITSHLIQEKLDNLKEGESEHFKEIIDIISTWMIYNDRPVHTRLRKFMNQAFMRKELEIIKPEIAKITHTLIQKITDSGCTEIDFVEEIAHPLPAMILCKMLGLDESEAGKFIKWSDDIADFMQNFVVSSVPDKGVSDITKKSMREMFDFLFETIKSRRNIPRNDLISRLANSEKFEDGAMLGDAEIAAQTVHLIFGGHKIPQFMLTNMLHCLITHPEQMEALKQDSSLLDNALMESMRFEGPIQYVTRHASKDIVLHGETIKKYDSVYLFLGAANRDPRAFQYPDMFNIQREEKLNHVAFGGGYHACIGAAFVQMELNVILEGLFGAFKDIQSNYNIQSPDWSHNPTFHGIKSMSIKVK
ncbi:MULTISPECIES: cytochrome P450 [Photorhabdus]|uniref:Cytochrome p450 n=1 Tax=Photorhabdus thracensis TaxID=230089 RepID=A0A0F7LPB7_9GAMM|nr:cytochrome P450 [Photorhabdus thracensis]AKH63652.1 cytochrome p450 [Photorhabdus thracensis]